MLGASWKTSLSLRDVKGENRKNEFPIRVILAPEDVPPSCFAFLAFASLEVWMRFNALPKLAEHMAEILEGAEHNQAGFGITPSQVTQELVNGLTSDLRPAPEF